MKNKKYTLKNKIVFQFKNDYVQFIPNKKMKWSWFSFNFAHIHFEKDILSGPAYDFCFQLMGLGFYVRYNTDKAMRLYDKWMKEIENDKLYKVLKKKNVKKTKR